MTDQFLTRTNPDTSHLDAFEAVSAPDYFERLTELVATKTETYPGGLTVASMIDHLSRHDDGFAALNPDTNETNSQALLDAIARTSAVEIVRGFMSGKNSLVKETRKGTFLQKSVDEMVSLGVKVSNVIVTLDITPREDDPLFVLDSGKFITRIGVRFIKPTQDTARERKVPSILIKTHIDDHRFQLGHPSHKTENNFAYSEQRDASTFDGDFDPRLVLIIAAELTKMHNEQNERALTNRLTHVRAALDSQVAEYLRGF